MHENEENVIFATVYVYRHYRLSFEQIVNYNHNSVFD